MGRIAIPFFLSRSGVGWIGYAVSLFSEWDGSEGLKKNNLSQWRPALRGLEMNLRHADMVVVGKHFTFLLVVV